MTEQLLAPLQPNEMALTPLLQANVEEDMLRENANAGYGVKADECHVLLQQILRTGIVASDSFNLREVLELIRWDAGPGRRGDWKRLFACAALIQLAPKSPEAFCGECETLAPLLVSAIDLGESVARAAAGMLCWRF